jgi:hypothetical protein
VRRPLSQLIQHSMPRRQSLVCILVSVERSNLCADAIEFQQRHRGLQRFVLRRLVTCEECGLGMS